MIVLPLAAELPAAMDLDRRISLGLAKCHVRENQRASLRPVVDSLVREFGTMKQRTPEWFAARRKCVTGSILADAIGLNGPAAQRDVITKKVCPHRDTFRGSAATRWGTMFEPVAIALYEAYFLAQVFEVALVTSLKHPSIAASPDGLTSHGKAIEIKCAYSRRSMYVEKNHFYQMQSQMLVCNLPECDYMKCFFRRVTSSEGDESEAWIFWREAAITTTPFGIILESEDDDGNPHWEYSPVDMNARELLAWFNANKSEHQLPIFWFLDNVFLDRVIADPVVQAEIVQKTSEVMEIIEEHRKDPEAYERSLPLTRADLNNVRFRERCIATRQTRNHDVLQELAAASSTGR